VDHTLTDQSSVIRFVEDNWGLPRITNSFDAIAGSLDGLFDFGAKHVPNNRPFVLDPSTGQPRS
jgi:phospholipase C